MICDDKVDSLYDLFGDKLKSTFLTCQYPMAVPTIRNTFLFLNNVGSTKETYRPAINLQGGGELNRSSYARNYRILQDELLKISLDRNRTSLGAPVQKAPLTLKSSYYNLLPTSIPPRISFFWLTWCQKAKQFCWFGRRGGGDSPKFWKLESAITNGLTESLFRKIPGFGDPN